MLFNISYKDLKIERKINELVGKPYSLLERITKKGIGSPKLFITRCSKEIYDLLHVKIETAKRDKTPYSPLDAYL